MAYKSQGNKQSTSGSKASDKGQAKTIKSSEKVGSSDGNGICFPVHDHPDLSNVRTPRG